MKRKVGDAALVKSLAELKATTGTYFAHNNANIMHPSNDVTFNIDDMTKYCDTVVIINKIDENHIHVEQCDGYHRWYAEWMFKPFQAYTIEGGSYA